MKKIIAMALPVVLAVGTAGAATPVMAAESGDKKTTSVSLTVGESFTWSVPESLELAREDTGNAYSKEGDVTFSNCIIKDGYKIQIGATSGGSWKLNGEDYKLKSGETDLSAGNKVDISLTSGAGSCKVEASITPKKATASTQTDTVTFTASIVSST